MTMPAESDYTDRDLERIDSNVNGLAKAVEAVREENDALRERINTLEATVERLEATASGPELSKKEKHEAVINAAENKSGGPGGVSLGYGEIMAAANVSRRYSYTLMETMAAAYDWAEYDTSKQKNRLVITHGERGWAGLIASVHNNTSED